MAYDIHVEQAGLRTFASGRRRAAIPRLSTVIPAACDGV